VIDFCRGFARRYPLYPRLCGPAGDSRRRQRRRRQFRAVKRRRWAPRRRPPIGGRRPQGAALITRPCSTVSLDCTRLESTLPCIGASDVYIYLPIRGTYNPRCVYVYVCIIYIHIYIYIYLHTFIRAYMHTCTYARAQTHVCAPPLVHVHVRYPSHVGTRARACARERERERERERQSGHLVESGTGCKVTAMTTGNGIARRSLCSRTSWNERERTNELDKWQIASAGWMKRR